MASNSNSRPPSGRKSTTKKSSNLANKEQQFKDLNAALEEKTAALFSDVESVLRGQDELFSTFDEVDTDFSTPDLSSFITSDNTFQDIKKTNLQDKPQNNFQQPKNNIRKTQKKTLSGQVRPMTTSSIPPKKKPSSKPRSQSSKGFHKISSTDLIEERATLADKINTLELEAADDLYEPSNLNEGVLPDVANEMGPDAIIRFLKAKLRVMQEELDAAVLELRQKSSAILKLQNEAKERDDTALTMNKKIEHLQNTIEKHKSTQDELRLKNSNLELDISTLKKDLESKRRENKQSLSNKNSLEVRLNRALEEVEKYKSALQKSKETSKVSNDSDKKRVEQLQNDNRRLEKQKAELMTAFKKQLKLIDVLKRQKMHLEAAKMLEFTEDEFVRALEWGK